MRRREGLLTDAERLKSAPEQLPERVAALVEERRRLDRELAETVYRPVAAAATLVLTIAGVAFAGRVLDGVPARDLRGMADGLKQQVGSGVVAIASADQGKASLLWATEDLTDRLSAVELVRVGAAILGAPAAAGGPTWLRPAAPMGTPRRRRLPPSSRRWLPVSGWESRHDGGDTL